LPKQYKLLPIFPARNGSAGAGKLFPGHIIKPVPVVRIVDRAKDPVRQRGWGFLFKQQRFLSFDRKTIKSMCGRYSVSKKNDEIRVRFSASIACDGELQRYNVAPTQPSAVITSDEPSLIRMFRWGLVPYNAADLATGTRYINGRAETLLEKYPFANLVESKRCIIPADGFYEWKKKGNIKIPHRFTLADEGLFAFAGLWDAWADRSTGEIIHSFTIITVKPNELVAPVHDRMPAILPPDHEKLWLDISIPPAEAVKLLQPYPAELMKSIIVSTLVNSPFNESAAVLQRAEYNIMEQGSLDL
jgi:putative SOS response-associated peptidase YedK